MNIFIREMGCREYEQVWDEMRLFTKTRQPNSNDEIWIVEHPAVFTLGRAGKEEHVLNTDGLTIVRSDRGGQVTYHGPGQLVLYTLLDVRRLKIGPRELVRRIEQGVINYLEKIGISGARKEKAPGVYIEGKKIAALGLRIRSGFSYHGMSINVNMNLSPYGRINTCGFEDLEVTQLIDHDGPDNLTDVSVKIVPELCTTLYDGKSVSRVYK
jgi:lipoyl(octanoyl) transferase